MGKLSGLFEKHPHAPVVVDPRSRRMFLKGLSGTALALPFLPSLASQALAAAGEAEYRKAAFLVFSHGVYWDNWAPTNVPLSPVSANVRAGPLAGATFGSYFPSDFANVRGKLSILDGLDMLQAVGHARNTALAAGGHFEGNDTNNPRSPNSIDVVLARSAKVYPAPGKIPVLRVDPYDGGYSHCYENGSHIFLDESRSRPLFDKVLGKLGAGGAMPPAPAGLSASERQARRKKLMVDSSLSSIQALLGSSRLSSADKGVAGNFFDFMRDVQTRVNAEAQPSMGTPALPPTSYSCPQPYGADGASALSRAKNMADITVMAMACGVTRLSYFALLSEHDYVHTVDGSSERTAHANFLRNESLPVASHVMNRMEQLVEGNGKTMLDNSAVLLTSDLASSKYDNHCGVNAPVLVGGSLNGLLRTGQMISYANTSAPLNPGGYTGRQLYGGRPYNDLLVSILRGFGLTSAEYRGGSPGFGVYDCQSNVGSCGAGNSTTHRDLLSYYSSRYFAAGSNPNKDVPLPHYFLG